MGMFKYLRDNNLVANYAKAEELRLIEKENNLRDAIAIEAINIFSTNKEDILKILENIPARHDLVAKFCYDLANAMIKERSKYGT